MENPPVRPLTALFAAWPEDRAAIPFVGDVPVTSHPAGIFITQAKVEVKIGIGYVSAAESVPLSFPF